MGPRPSRVSDVGVLVDAAVHDVDLVRFLTGREYASVDVQIEAVDAAGVDLAARITALLDDGTDVTHEVSWCEEETIRTIAIDDRTVDLIPVDRAASLVAQDGAFVTACFGGGRGGLARATDGAAALAVVSRQTV
jgi:predicted dehydrogenase